MYVFGLGWKNLWVRPANQDPPQVNQAVPPQVSQVVPPQVNQDPPQSYWVVPVQANKDHPPVYRLVPRQLNQAPPKVKWVFPPQVNQNPPQVYQVVPQQVNQVPQQVKRIVLPRVYHRRNRVATAETESTASSSFTVSKNVKCYLFLSIKMLNVCFIIIRCFYHFLQPRNEIIVVEYPDDSVAEAVIISSTFH